MLKARKETYLRNLFKQISDICKDKFEGFFFKCSFISTKR